MIRSHTWVRILRKLNQVLEQVCAPPRSSRRYWQHPRCGNGPRLPAGAVKTMQSARSVEYYSATRKRNADICDDTTDWRLLCSVKQARHGRADTGSGMETQGGQRADWNEWWCQGLQAREIGSCWKGYNVAGLPDE